MNIRVATGAVGMLCISAWSLNKNQSIEFVQDASRNASTGADAAYHNPAGLAFLPGNGLHLNVGNQVIVQNPSIEEKSPLLDAYGPGTYEGDVRIWALPTLDAVYRMDDLSFYFHAAPLSGGGEVVYDEGLPQFDNMILGFAEGIGSGTRSAVDAGYQQQLAAAGIPDQHVTTGSGMGFVYERDLSFTADVVTFAGTFGTAYRILPTLSTSIAYRFAYASNSYKGSAKPSRLGVVFQGSQGLLAAGISGASVDSALNANANHAIDSLWQDIDVDVTQSGVAHGVILGLDFKPDDVWNFGLRFEWNSELELENTSSTVKAPDALLPYLSNFEEGAKTKATEPMVVAGGISFKPIPDLTLESSATYGFAELVDHDGAEDNYHNSFFGGLGARYMFTKRIEGALGYAYDRTYKNNIARSEADPDNPTHYMSTGIGFQATPRLRFNGGAMIGFVQERHATSIASGASQTVNSQYLTFGLGVNWSPSI